MCNNGPAWKREVVPDHKFDFVDTREFHSKDCWVRIQYLWVYILVLKSFLVYVSDIFTGITMITTDNWTNEIFRSCPETSEESNGCVFIRFDIAKWLFVGCIIFSFLLLAYEARKAKKIIASRDISYAFTNVMANNYYSLRSYDHFCFFCHINNSTTWKDDFAFFIFFTFKGWKRLLLADGPRQSINALTLYSFYLAKRDLPGAFWYLPKYSDDLFTLGLLITIAFTVVVFAGSMLLLIAAAICYLPLLCYIQGNLKEFCCHKVDKRISEVVKRKNKQRLNKQAELAAKEAAGDYSHLRNKKGQLIAAPLPQPTLPNVSIDDVEAPPKNRYWDSDQKSYQASEYQASIAAAPDYPPLDYPPMPMNPYSQPGYATYGQSVPNLHDDGASESDYASTAHFRRHGGGSGSQDYYSSASQSQTYVGDPRDVYDHYSSGARAGYAAYGSQQGGSYNHDSYYSSTASSNARDAPYPSRTPSAGDPYRHPSPAASRTPSRGDPYAQMRAPSRGDPYAHPSQDSGYRGATSNHTHFAGGRAM